jgi:hypothetical protein
VTIKARIRYDAALSAYVPLPADATCAACNSGMLPVRDHCHEHGWVRDIVCMRCNAYLALIDRGFAPGVTDDHFAELLAVRNLCPDCKPIGDADLKPRDPRGEREPEPSEPSQDPLMRRARLRRAAERQGYRLVKIRQTDPLALNYGRYKVTARSGTLPADRFASSDGHGLSLDEVEQRLLNP